MRLAGAEKPCPVCNGIGEVESETDEQGWFNCTNCQENGGGSTGEVYVLGEEVRVECTFGDGSYYGQQGAYPMYSKAGTHGDPAADSTCNCGGLGFTALDPHDMRWMMVLRDAEFLVKVRSIPHGRFMATVGFVDVIREGEADTPWDALLLAATKALGLEVKA